MKGNNDIIGIGLESSCDETAVGIVHNGTDVLANCIFSQVDLHSEYFGVVPEIASRSHLEVINALIRKALQGAGISFKDLHYVAATNRPGLVGSLLIALQSAKAISYTGNIPFIAVNHLEAHLYAPFLEGNALRYPFIGLLVSGGNTAVYRVEGAGRMELIGKTVDDAAGEAFDKIAKFANLGYPGGPRIEKMAETARERRKLFPKILSDSPDDTRFSYSGLKTAVINFMKENPGTPLEEIVYSFQERALELLVRRVFTAARKQSVATIVVAGGVAANGRLRQLLEEERRPGETVLIPSPILCTDNAAMVAGIGYRYFLQGSFSTLTEDVFARSQ
ncbi:MAG TPA: tRNA (adenosine(37)-N6)-threonylcarbamoyltransferase complex transferase subunit TsaD [Spirochaetota bacterium]|nr:tRNA (adenosine(37)-N6)-threonylcarbamoyltransferase complex transferase subunit TsaD [Spirochaetota bacterium]